MINNKVFEDENKVILVTQPGKGINKQASPLWTVEEVSSYLKLQPETIRSMARRGELPAIKLGKVWRFEKTAIDDLLVTHGLA
jgi:excisionase family DNA binding protein